MTAGSHGSPDDGMCVMELEGGRFPAQTPLTGTTRGARSAPVATSSVRTPFAGAAT